MKRILTATLMTFTSSFAIAANLNMSHNGNFDCGTLSQDQESKLVAQSQANQLQDYARACSEQAETFQRLANEAKETLPRDDVKELFTKAANAHLHVASFTNESLMK